DLAYYFSPVPTVRLCLHATAAPDLYTLSLHDALPISPPQTAFHRSNTYRRSGSRTPPRRCRCACRPAARRDRAAASKPPPRSGRSEEHTSELQSRENLVCRLLLEKKKKTR